MPSVALIAACAASSLSNSANPKRLLMPRGSVTTRHVRTVPNSERACCRSSESTAGSRGCKFLEGLSEVDVKDTLQISGVASCSVARALRSGPCSRAGMAMAAHACTRLTPKRQPGNKERVVIRGAYLDEDVWLGRCASMLVLAGPDNPNGSAPQHGMVEVTFSFVGCNITTICLASLELARAWRTPACGLFQHLGGTSRSSGKVGENPPHVRLVVTWTTYREPSNKRNENTTGHAPA
jgi:hypothetical protein